MQDVIAPYLTSTYKMIECAFPDGPVLLEDFDDETECYPESFG